MTINRLTPLSFTGSSGVTQLVGFSPSFCCNPNPVEGDGQATTTVFVGVTRTVKRGTPDVWAASSAQKPLVSV